MLYTLTIGLSAFLLFLVQPLISKLLLPWFGGGASVWISSLVFFQSMLLVGYAGAHFLIRWLGLKRQLVVTSILLAASLAFLPISAGTTFGGALPPSVQLFALLLVSIGIPYLVLAMTSPTLQYWIANDVRTEAASPYIQYGVSNAGSLAGLIAFPFLFEIAFTSSTQSLIWTLLYAGYVALMACTIVLFLRHNPGTREVSPVRMDLSSGVRITWIFQAMVPSALLLVTTHFLTLDVANLPLLWVAPLCIYLTTFILCFLFPGLSAPNAVRTLLAIGSILVLLVVNHGFFDFGFTARIAATLACLFFVCMVFHGDLERGKPHKRDLTNFYLNLSLGGALGSIAAGIVAPLIFDSTFEFLLVLIVALYYLVTTRFALRDTLFWFFRGAVAGSVVISWLTHETGFANDTIYYARSFYSTYAVREITDVKPVRRLVAGTHVHGAQYLDPADAHEPISYYHRDTGVGHLFDVLEPNTVGAVGLGVGAIVEYGSEGDTFDLIELDPMVIDIATGYFSVLREAEPELNYLVGDGRIELRKQPDDRYDLLVLDAFTSGSIPTHLVTLEAIEEMMAKTKSRGAIAYHISNHHLDLMPVLNAIGRELDLHVRVHQSGGSVNLHKFPARWVVLTRNESLTRTLVNQYEWKMPPPEAILWHDGYSNIYSILK